jgi:hypothetical protein
MGNRVYLQECLAFPPPQLVLWDGQAASWHSREQYRVLESLGHPEHLWSPTFWAHAEHIVIVRFASMHALTTLRYSSVSSRLHDLFSFITVFINIFTPSNVSASSGPLPKSAILRCDPNMRFQGLNRGSPSSFMAFNDLSLFGFESGHVHEWIHFQSHERTPFQVDSK